MLDKRKYALISLINLTLSIGLVTAQVIDTEPKDQIIVEVGQKAVFLCRYGEPIVYCRISMPGIDALNLSPDWGAENGYGYYGGGFNQGQCGVAIDRVPASANGDITCHLGIRSREISKSIKLMVAVAPDPPQMAISDKAKNNNLEVNEEFIAECVARGGRPAANISFYLDDEPIEQHGQQQEVHERIGRDNSTTYETTHTISWNLRASDNGRTLTCRAYHFAYPNNHSDVSTQIVVNYRPQPLSEIRVFGLVLQNTAIVNVTISSNPRPRIEWIIDGTSIPQGTQHGRYEANQPTDLGRGDYNVTLSIAGLTLEDTTKIYRLRASNSFGVTEYVVRISSSEAARDSGLGIGAVIGIIVAAIIVLVVIILVVVARITGRWCFADHSAAHTKPSETNDGVGDTLLPSPSEIVSIVPSPVTSATASAAAAINNTNDQAVYRNTTVPMKKSNLSLSREKLTLNLRNVFQPSKNINNQKNLGQTAAQAAIVPAAVIAAPHEETEDEEQKRLIKDLLKEQRLSELNRYSQFPPTPSICSFDTNVSSNDNGSTAPVGNYNELGIPSAQSPNRWLPSTQRELLEKQANLLVNKPLNSPFKKETSI